MDEEEEEESSGDPNFIIHGRYNLRTSGNRVLPLCSRTPHSIPAIHEAETMAFRRGRLLAAVIPRRRTGREAAPGARSSILPGAGVRAATPAGRDSSAFVIRVALVSGAVLTSFPLLANTHRTSNNSGEMESRTLTGFPRRTPTGIITAASPSIGGGTEYQKNPTFHRVRVLFVMRYEKSTNARRVLCSEGAGTGVRWTVLAYEV